MEEIEYQRESDCQDYADYGPQGYHPVSLGEKYDGKYVVHQKLGWGYFSTVWLVYNETNGQYCALKIQKSKDTHAQSAIDQLEMLTRIRKHENDQPWIQFVKNISQNHPNLVSVQMCKPLELLDNFIHYGIHGKHYCSVFELMGPNLLDLIQHYEFKDQRMPLWLIKKIVIDVLMGLVHLHQFCEIIHTDLKPQNIMMKLPLQIQKQLINQIKKYHVKPLSMKYLKNISAVKNGKSKKRNQKKKLKKKLLKNQGQQIKQQSNMDVEVKKQQIIQQNNNEDLNGNNDNNGNGISQQKMIKTLQISKPECERQVLVEINQKNQTQSQKIQDDTKQNSKEKDSNDKSKQKEDLLTMKWKNVNIKLSSQIFFKIADMGNACFINKHYTDNIQTRQYRSPQVLIGHQYYTNTDLWSLACVVFQMMTNTFLFKPKRLDGISTDQDHLYKIIQVLGPIPKDFAIEGTESNNIFNKKGKLIHGNPKQQIRIFTLLKQDFGYSQQEALEAQKFLLPMLAYQPKNRISVRQCLKSQWLWK